jgi:hypothetical protein
MSEENKNVRRPNRFVDYWDEKTIDEHCSELDYDEDLELVFPNRGAPGFIEIQPVVNMVGLSTIPSGSILGSTGELKKV